MGDVSGFVLQRQIEPRTAGADPRQRWAWREACIRSGLLFGFALKHEPPALLAQFPNCLDARIGLEEILDPGNLGGINSLGNGLDCFSIAIPMPHQRPANGDFPVVAAQVFRDPDDLSRLPLKQPGALGRADIAFPCDVKQPGVGAAERFARLLCAFREARHTAIPQIQNLARPERGRTARVKRFEPLSDGTFCLFVQARERGAAPQGRVREQGHGQWCAGRLRAVPHIEFETGAPTAKPDHETQQSRLHSNRG